MAKAPFKLKGYPYPGTAPVKHFTGVDHSETDPEHKTPPPPPSDTTTTKKDPYAYEKILLEQEKEGKTPLGPSESKILGRYREHLHKTKK